MKFSTLLMEVLMMLPFFLQSQNRVYTEEFNRDTRIQEANTFLGRTCAALSNGKVYAIKGPVGNDKKRMLHVYDLATHQHEEIAFADTRDTKVLFRSRIDALEVIGDHIVILTDPAIVVLKIHKGKAEFVQKTANTKSFNLIKKLGNDKLFLYVNYNFHPMDAPDKHVWACYDLTKNEIMQSKKMPDDNAIFSHYVNSWLSICGDRIAYSKTTEYSVYFYNSAFEKTDSITSDLLSSNRKYLDRFTKPFEFSKDNIMSIQQSDDSVLTRIQKVFYLDPAHVLLTLKLPKLKKLGIHLWEKRSNAWSLIRTDSIPYFYEQGKAYTAEDNSMTGFYGNADALLNDGKGSIYYIYSPYMDKILTGSFDMQTDYTDKINELIKNNHMTYGLKKFTFGIK